ncbi:MAG: hypothetical protein WC639_03415 [Patescibacteria group bacterium]
MGNIKKFVEDNPQLGEERIKGILERAEAVSFNNVISGDSVEAIMQDDVLAAKFSYIVMSEPEHMKIVLSIFGATRLASRVE